MLKCKTISIASCKGGISKTTSAINLGTALAMQGWKVLLVDNDSQANLTTYLDLKSSVKISLPNLIKAVMENISADELYTLVNGSILKTKYLDVIPSHINMSGLEMGIAMATSREYIMTAILENVKNNYDFILIDNLPSLGIFAVNALVASDSVLIPVETHYGSLEGFDQIICTINMVKQRLNPKLSIEGVIMTKHQERTTFCRSIHRQIKAECGEAVKLFEPPIPYSIKVAETSALGISIFEHDPKGSAAIVYDTIAREVAANVG